VVDAALGLALAAPANSARVPGLRGGDTLITRHRIVLHAVAWFRGMRVSGGFDLDDEVGRLTVGGPAASGGTLTLVGDHARGTLGGHPVRDADFK
jgi:hypothetical protein